MTRSTVCGAVMDCRSQAAATAANLGTAAILLLPLLLLQVWEVASGKCLFSIAHKQVRYGEGG